VKSRDSASLVELTDERMLVVEGPEGRFVHELVVPFVSTTAHTIPAPQRGIGRAKGAAPRIFPPGSEWLYAKLYGGTASADLILKDVVAPVVSSTAPERWFFLRYGDPHWHIRLRLRGDAAHLLSSTLPALRERLQPLLADGRVSKFQLDTYVREIERYGGFAAIEHAEAVFEADSAAALGIIELLDADEGADARWRLAFRGIHLLLLDCGLSLAERIDVVRRARTRLGVEHRLDVELERAIGQRFRKERAALEELLAPAPTAEHPLAPGFALLAERSRRIAPSVRMLQEARVSLSDVVSSFAHMHANRLLRSEARAQELVLYDLLLRLYESESARARGRRP
jgi:thiopeptide-type bacteriocin biosynthesis protein